jgi:alpha-ketoglutarate-dependent 2,4-dichlorophenoxyacetate dioxygenase
MSFDEIFDVGNINPQNEVCNELNDIKRTTSNNGNATWHADGAFNARRDGYSILRAVELPPPGTGGETNFANARRAYEDLSPVLKAKVDKLVTLNSLYHNRKVANPDYEPFQKIEVLEHPVSRRKLAPMHYPTGQRSLYVTSYAHCIEGMPIEDGQKLLKELLEYITKDEYIYTLEWESPGDLVIWDNTQVLHRATKGEYLYKYRRDMRRVSTFDMSPEGYGLNEQKMWVTATPV